MDGHSTLNIFCSQYYPVLEKRGILRKPQLRYLHRPVFEYPFVVSKKPNRTLLVAIQNELSFFFGNAYVPALFGELWTIIDDPVNRKRWGLFALSEPISSGEKRGGCILNYVLCPTAAISLLSRTELISAIRRADLIKEWGREQIAARKNTVFQGTALSDNLLNHLKSHPASQLICGGGSADTVRFWLDQIWRGTRGSKTTVSCFCAYQEMRIENVLFHRTPSPQLLILPKDSFNMIRKNKRRVELPIRGTIPPRKAAEMFFSSDSSKNKWDLLLLYDRKDDVNTEKLQRLMIEDDNSIQLPPDSLRALMEKYNVLSVKSHRQTTPYLYHIRTGKSIEIHSLPFWIGSQRSGIDFRITWNPTISGRHAYLTRTSSGYAIVDHNSKNHTLLNGKMLHPGVEEPLFPGAQICLSNETFIFLAGER